MTFSGIVIGGSARAGSLGFPTANLLLGESDASGIYAAQARAEGKQYAAVCYADPTRGILETHLLDFSGDLYGIELSVTLVEKIRDAQVFTSEEELKKAIAGDSERARSILGKL